MSDPLINGLDLAMIPVQRRLEVGELISIEHDHEVVEYRVMDALSAGDATWTYLLTPSDATWTYLLTLNSPDTDQADALDGGAPYSDSCGRRHHWRCTILRWFRGCIHDPKMGSAESQ